MLVFEKGQNRSTLREKSFKSMKGTNNKFVLHIASELGVEFGRNCKRQVSPPDYPALASPLH